MGKPATLETPDERQATLLNLESKEYNPYWVDPQQPLQVPVEPLHAMAHRYQLILARLDVMAQKNPAQFNSGNYIAIMEKLEKIWERINAGESTIQTNNEGGVAGQGDDQAAPEVGQGASAGVATGVSPDNPLSR